MGEEIQKNGERREIEAIVDSLTLFDDDLMSRCFDENIPAAEYLLRVILGRDDIYVLSVHGQVETKNPVVGGRNIRLDILIRDAEGLQYNVEVQRNRIGADVRRARFHSSMVDVRMLSEKQKFKGLNDSYVIFITETDYFKKEKPIYTVKRVIDEIEEDFNDGSHIIYVNGAYQGNDDIGRLMHDFHCKNSCDIYNPTLAESVRHFKEEGGREEMCEAVQKYGNQREKRGEERGRILATIQMGIEYGASKAKIIEDLQTKIGLSEEAAIRAFNDFMN